LFTGPVTMHADYRPDLSKNFSLRQVNFSPGVRNKFHSHSGEQILIVTEGRGIVATEKGEITVAREMLSTFRPARNTGMGPPRVSFFPYLCPVSGQ